MLRPRRATPAPALALSFDNLGGSDDDINEPVVSTISGAWVGLTRRSQRGGDENSHYPF